MYMRMDIDKIFNLFDGSSLENKAEEASDTYHYPRNTYVLDWDV
jgi:hypothetical protein